VQVITTQPGPQTEAAKCTADILVFGGAAGGSKSWFLQYDAAKHAHVPGYDAIIFRRTSEELKGGGGIWEETHKSGIYRAVGGKPNWTELYWRFPSRALVKFSHLQHEKDKEAHKSKQYAYIGLDEATDFTESQFWFLLSRNRSVCGVRPKMRLTCNPDPDSWLKKLIQWWIGKDGLPIPERSGVVRYVYRQGEDLVWSDDREKLVPLVPVVEGEDPRLSILSVAFIASSVFDNKILLEQDPRYLSRLRNLTPAEQDRFLHGNWNRRVQAGDMFQRGWFHELHPSPLMRATMGQPIDLIWKDEIRVWDLAATPVKGDLVSGVWRPPEFMARDPSEDGASDDPDWTRGTRITRARDGRRRVKDMVSCRDTPGAVEELIKRTAMSDGPRVAVVLPQDPGQGAMYQVEAISKSLRKQGIKVAIVPVQKSKLEYAKPVSRAVYQGKWYYDVGDWNAPFFNELEQFPPKKKAVGRRMVMAHDDVADTLSIGEVYFDENPIPVVDYERVPAVDPRPDPWDDEDDDYEDDVRTTTRVLEML